MDVEDAPSHIEIIRSADINKRKGLNSQLQKLLNSNQCKNTALSQSCTLGGCRIVVYYNKPKVAQAQLSSNTLYYSKKEVYHNNVNDIRGFISVVTTSDTTAEIFNLCTAAPYTTQELLKYVITNPSHVLNTCDGTECNTNVDYWIGLKMSSPQFDDNVKIFAYLGFSNPVIARESPSGINLNYEFMAFQRNHTKPYKITKNDANIVINAANSLKRSSEDVTSNIFAPKEAVQQIKFKSFPAHYKSGVVVGDQVPLLKSKSPVKVSSKKPSPTKIPVKPSPKNPPLPIGKQPYKSVDKAPTIQKIVPENRFENSVPLYRMNKKATYVQMACLNGYFPKGRLIDGAQLSAADVNATIKILKEGGYIYEGTYGIVYQVCDASKNCNYVMKVQNLTSEGQINDWKKEVELMIKFNKYDIGPIVSAAWMCHNKLTEQVFGIFTSEIWDGNLGAGDIDACPSKELIDKIERQIKTIHKLGYAHGDIMPKNILVKKDSNGIITDVTVTDFGTVDTPEEWRRKQSEYDWINTFYDYHINYVKNNTFLRPYFTNSFITLEDVIADPMLLDNDIVYYLRNRCK